MASLTKKQFIAALVPHVLQVRKEGSPMFPSVRIAQNLLETGGKIHPWNNLGGIKVGSGKLNAYWKGKWVKKGTWEVESGVRVDTAAYFRAYDTLYDFYKDQDLLFQLPRYRDVREAGTPEEQAKALRSCGYATDPQYAEKIVALIKANGLTKYDEAATPDKGEKTLDKAKAIVNGKPIADGVIIDGKVYVPARDVGEAFGASVAWDNKTKTATLTSK
ncbi:glucosaminidase domain-containing protein [Cohnella cholangitidis]|uniref:glucosaminidase domain-containing protein n=1 Tax=Cohnella cholangitidis TaxID=2598458 RepID=UPI001E3935B3|nr:glucosaminidase domain-containing protein [Cohnella cholangitidis]